MDSLFSQPEDRISYNSGAFDYIYQYKDHLGNVRLSYDKNLAIVEENNYYPFGLKQNGYNNNPNYSYGNAQAEKVKYNGKEFQDDNIGGQQLNLYDYGARNYDPALGRWMNIDPLAEISRRFSPYTYANDNPVFFIDPDGMSARSFGEGSHEDPEYKRYSSTDASGSDRFDENNIYIPPSERIKPSGDNGSMASATGDTSESSNDNSNSGGDQIDPKKKKSGEIKSIDEVFPNLKEPQEFGMGLMEYVEGGAINVLVKGAKIVKESSLAKKTVVIGEDMANRVIPFAEKYGYKYFKPTGTNPANWMRNQSQWIYRQIKDPAVRIIDIGSKELEATSKYYKKELEMIKKYLNK